MKAVQARTRDAQTLLYGASALLSAFLLFSIEPMIAKMGVPLFGGSPAVWTICLVFFQVLLLAAYGYAHASAQRLPPRTQALVHLLVLVGPLAVLPPAFTAANATSTSEWPVASLVAALTVSVGLPFFALSTNGTFTQRWYALRTGREPYALYAASNAGSFLALFAYPILVEPNVDLRLQAKLFAAGYVVFVALSATCMALALRAPALPVEVAPISPSVAPFRLGGPLGWTLRAMAPSVLLVTVSLRISTDVGSVPLIWLVPLALYLLTFIVAFMPSLERVPRPVLAVPAAVLAVAILAWPRTFSQGGLVYMLGPLGVLFLGSWVCHGDLARSRPPSERLTAFYLWIAVGGAIGSALANLVPPFLFRSFTEYPVSLVLLLAALAAAPGTWQRRGGARLLGIGSAGALALVFVYLQRTRGDERHVVFSARSFYGTLQVIDSGDWRTLVHGSTAHGEERRGSDASRSAPASYYVPDAPMAWAMTHTEGAIGVVGLGTGSLAWYLRPGQKLTFYELDPMIERVAREYFTYLPATKGDVRVVVGDARLRLSESGERYGAIIVDAFSSDAIPVHLITEEAIRLYLAHLSEDGVVYVHVSNRYLDLLPVVRSHVKELGVHGFLRRYFPNAAARGAGAQGSDVVALTASDAARDRLLRGEWTPLDVDRKRVRWTDERSSLLPIFRKKPTR